MIKMTAVHEIVRGIRGEREVIPPAAQFSASESEADYLTRIGAALRTGEVVQRTSAAPTSTVVTGKTTQENTDAPETTDAENDTPAADTGDDTADTDAGDETTTEDAGTEAGDQDKPLSEMTVKELVAYAEVRQIEVNPKARRDAIIETILAAEQDEFI